MTSRHGIAVATTSELAASAAAETAAAGGNAVDCAVAASMVAMNTQPGVCSLAGGAYVTVWDPAGEPVTIDGGVAIPGLEMDEAYRPDDGTALHLAYGGGVDTVVGCASVGVPGALAACARAVERFGALPWETILSPVVRIAREGFPLPRACHYYLESSGGPIFCRSDDGRRALYDRHGKLRGVGDTVVVPHLADSLQAIASGGSDVFYRGPIADAIVDHVRRGGGRLTAADLDRYVPLERPSLVARLDAWRIALNPPPAVGGAVLAALLMLSRDAVAAAGSDEARVVDTIVAAQRAVLDWRRTRLDLSEEVARDAQTLLELAASGRLARGSSQSAATVHSSAVDAAGLGCSITSSAGYGAGEMPDGTGLWLNNCLGELELNRRGLDTGPAGARLPSNMAPGVARCADATLAFGSPGADRITTALQQFLLRHLLLGIELRQANEAARVHVEVAREPVSVSAEEGVDVTALALPVTSFPPSSMYFGGVGVARVDEGGQLTASADPRRSGGVFIGP